MTCLWCMPRTFPARLAFRQYPGWVSLFPKQSATRSSGRGLLGSCATLSHRSYPSFPSTSMSWSVPGLLSRRRRASGYELPSTRSCVMPSRGPGDFDEVSTREVTEPVVGMAAGHAGAALPTLHLPAVPAVLPVHAVLLGVRTDSTATLWSSQRHLAGRPSTAALQPLERRGRGPRSTEETIGRPSPRGVVARLH